MGSSQPPNLTLVSDVEPASPNGAQSHHHKANLRIMELENEVVMLTGKATAQADKLEDTELELDRLRAMTSTSSSTPAVAPEPTPPMPPRKQSIVRKPLPNSALHTKASNASLAPSAMPDSPPRPATAPANETGSRTTSPDTLTPPLPPLPAQASSGYTIQGSLRRATSLRFASFMRKTSNDSTTPPVPVNTQAALESEHSRRVAAETKLTQVNTELEDLSATLFSQANEMVSTERRLRAEAEEQYKEREKSWDERGQAQEKRIARLEERVKVLEERDRERVKRLEMLERGMRRVGRVRGLVANGKG